MEKKTWRLVQLLADRKALDCKWILKKKQRTNGILDKYKARLMAKTMLQFWIIMKLSLQ